MPEGDSVPTRASGTTEAAAETAGAAPPGAGRGPLDVAALVREHARTVWRLAYGMLGDPGAAEDVAQETFLRAHRARGTFRGQAPARTWLLSICRNLCRDRLRAPHPDHVPLDAAPVGALEAAPADPGRQVVLRRVLAEGLRALPAGEREAVVLVDVLGFTAAEGARLTGVPATTLRSRRSRAHARLVQHVLGGDPDDL